MAVREDHDHAVRALATFELERFVWAAPDRLEVAGKFDGLGDASTGPPHLVVHGEESVHHLPAAPDRAAPALEDGAPWAAEFVWQEPPVSFDVATLELGDDIFVELPPPGGRLRRNRGVTLEVRTAGEPPSAEAVEWEEPSAARAAERVGLEAELLAAREEIRELREAAERMQEELSRAHDDLNSERERHAGDAERFREGLEHVRTSAAEAVAAEHHALTDTESVLRETRAAMQAKDAELDEARRTADEARAGAEEVLKRLDAIRHALGDGA
jgi:hypothetical protein